MPRGIPNKKLEVAAPTDEVQLKRESIFLQALKSILPTLRLYTEDQLRKKIGQERLTDASLEFFSYLESGTNETLTQVEKLALSIQLLKALSKYINTVMKFPVTLKTTLDCVSLIEPAVENCFPGYHASKLLKYTILPVRVAV